MPYKDLATKQAHMREYYARRIREWFADKACANCGSPNFLRLSQRDPGVPGNHRIWSMSQERRELELTKYHVLCLACKSVKRSEWYDLRLKHVAQTLVGCVCSDCEAFRERWS